MYHEVTIGQGDKGTSAFHVFELTGKHGISHNSKCYWISELIFDFYMTIFKDTPEGYALTGMIQRNETRDDITEWLNCTLLKNIETSVLLSAIEEEKDRAFEAGRKDKATEIRASLYMTTDFEICPVCTAHLRLFDTL